MILCSSSTHQRKLSSEEERVELASYRREIKNHEECFSNDDVCNDACAGCSTS